MQYIITTRYGQVEVNSYEELIDCLFPHGQFDGRVWKSCENDDDFWKSMSEENEHFSDLLKQATVAVNVLGRDSEIYIPPLLAEGNSEEAIEYVNVLKNVAQLHKAIEKGNVEIECYFDSVKTLAQWFLPNCGQPFVSFAKNSDEAAHWVDCYRIRHEFVHYDNEKGWFPKAGYVWQGEMTNCNIVSDDIFDPPDKVVEWTAELKHPNLPNIHASYTLGKWTADKGYSLEYEDGVLLGAVPKTSVSDYEINSRFHYRSSWSDQKYDEAVYGKNMSLSPLLKINEDDNVWCTIRDLTSEAKKKWVNEVIDGLSVWDKIKIGAQLAPLLLLAFFDLDAVFQILGDTYRLSYSWILRSASVEDCCWVWLSSNGVYFQRMKGAHDLCFVRWSEINKIGIDEKDCRMSINNTPMFLTLSKYHFNELAKAIYDLSNMCCKDKVRVEYKAICT